MLRSRFPQPGCVVAMPNCAFFRGAGQYKQGGRYSSGGSGSLAGWRAPIKANVKFRMPSAIRGPLLSSAPSVPLNSIEDYLCPTSEGVNHAIALRRGWGGGSGESPVGLTHVQTPLRGKPQRLLPIRVVREIRGQLPASRERRYTTDERITRNSSDRRPPTADL